MSFLDKIKGDLAKEVDKAQVYVDKHHGLGSTVQQGLDAVKLEREILISFASTSEIVLRGADRRFDR